MSLLSLKFQTLLYTICTRNSRNNKGVCSTCLFFGNLLNPRGLGCARTLRYSRLYPQQSQASLGGYYGGNPRTSPKSRQCFSKYFHLDPKLLVSLEKTDARHKQLRYESWGRLRLRDTAPPSPPYAYVAYERELSRRCLPKSYTKNTEIK